PAALRHVSQLCAVSPASGPVWLAVTPLPDLPSGPLICPIPVPSACGCPHGSGDLDAAHVQPGPHHPASGNLPPEFLPHALCSACVPAALSPPRLCPATAPDHG